MKRLIMGMAAALVLTGQAVADGPPKWTGFYVGAGLGVGAAVGELSIELNGIPLSFDGSGNAGTFGTVAAGYDHQFGEVVAGVFVDYDFGGRISSSFSTDPQLFGSLSLIDFNNSWSVGARLGFLANPGTQLVYGTHADRCGHLWRLPGSATSLEGNFLLARAWRLSSLRSGASSSSTATPTTTP